MSVEFNGNRMTAYRDVVRPATLSLGDIAG